MNAEEIIAMQGQLESQDAILRSRWQDEADYIFPRESNITDISMPGAPSNVKLYDTTAVTDSVNMTSGLMSNLIPTGQKFFSFGVDDEEIQEIEVVKSYMAKATSRLHAELFTSNFILQLTETLRSLVVYGTGCLFSEWRGGLNFTDWDISRYQVEEDFGGKVDTIYIKFPKTAKQAYEKWGSKAGESIVEIFKEPSADYKKQNEIFWFIHMVKPRKNWNPRLEDSSNWAWEERYVGIKDKNDIEEGGYPEFPYCVPRWTKTTGEAHGRGIGTFILPQVKKINVMSRDFLMIVNKSANPAIDVMDSFTGVYKTFPGARNNIIENPTGIPHQGSQGNYMETKDSLESERKIVSNAFYADAFAPITSSGPGDRRNELEIRQRIVEAFRKIGSISRLESELFTPQLTRCYLLLVRNGVLEKAPPELSGRDIKIIYRGPLSLAQQNSEVSASQRTIGIVAELEASSPSFANAMDNFDIDKTVRRWGRIEGMNEFDLAPEDVRDAKREQRQKQIAEQKALEVAQVAAGAYGQTTKAPEKGSAAEQMG